MSSKLKFCMDCSKKGLDTPLTASERYRCKECWNHKRIAWKLSDKQVADRELRANYTKPNSQNKPDLNANYIRSHNSLEHEMAKTKIIWEHMNEGHYLISEAQRKDGVIHDLVCNSCGAIEVVKTSLSPKLKDGEMEVHKI